MPENHAKQVFLHVGLGKVASTYLQYRVFPKFKGIHYIQRTKYWNYDKIIETSSEPKFLISREFDRQLETEVRKFAETFPNGRFIINLRRHDSWIASQYRRFVKNGMYLTFEEFLDLDKDDGFWKVQELTFFPMLQVLEEITGNRPKVLFHEQLKKDPFDFYDAIANYIGATYDRSDISLKPVHRSYSEKQLKIIRKFKLYKSEPYGNMRNPVDWLRRRWRFLLCYLILYPARLVPAAWVSQAPLISPESLERVRAHFADDWQRCVDYANKNAAVEAVGQS